MTKQPPIQPTPVGALRFNTVTAQLEYFDGNVYVNIITDSPEQHTGGTRALFGAGQESGSPGFVNTIEFVTIANTANVTDFGDLNETTFQGAVTGNETRYVYGGGTTPTVQIVIDFVTIATTGDATNFGD